MALDVQTGMLIRKLGHDGSQVVRPDLPDPNCRIGFHPQELIDYCWWMGFAVTPFEAMPRSVVEGQTFALQFQPSNVDRMLNILDGKVGVLTGQSLPSGSHHAVAWDGQRIFNPTGMVQNLSDFAINTFWCITPRK